MAESSTITREPNDSPQQQGAKALWYMHIAGPDDVHAVPDFWTGLAWAAELNAFVAARAAKEKWTADDNWPLTQATIRRWTWSADQHAKLLARELSEREEQASARAERATAPEVRDDVKCQCVSTFGANPECGACGGTGCVTAEAEGPKPGDLMFRSEWEASREISHDEAREIARRLIASHFRRTDTETARASIPANPDRDDDLLMCSYIKQQARKGAGSFQERVQPWMMACFGEMISRDREERSHRFLEEALELVQSKGCSAAEAHQLVDYVFGRPVGIDFQEVGGVMVTLAALCLANHIDMHQAGEVELARIWTKVEQIRAKQASKPKHSPLPEHVGSAALATGGARG